MISLLPATLLRDNFQWLMGFLPALSFLPAPSRPNAAAGDEGCHGGIDTNISSVGSHSPVLESGVDNVGAKVDELLMLAIDSSALAGTTDVGHTVFGSRGVNIPSSRSLSKIMIDPFA